MPKLIFYQPSSHYFGWHDWHPFPNHSVPSEWAPKKICIHLVQTLQESILRNSRDAVPSIHFHCRFLSTVALAEIWKNSYKTKLIDWSLLTVPNSPMCSCRKVGRSPGSRTRRRQRREERKRVKFCTMWQCLSEIKDDLCVVSSCCFPSLGADVGEKERSEQLIV